MYHYLFNKLSDGKHLLSLFVEKQDARMMDCMVMNKAWFLKSRLIYC